MKKEFIDVPSTKKFARGIIISVIAYIIVHVVINILLTNAGMTIISILGFFGAPRNTRFLIFIFTGPPMIGYIILNRIAVLFSKDISYRKGLWRGFLFGIIIILIQSVVIVTLGYKFVIYMGNKSDPRRVYNQQPIEAFRYSKKSTNTSQ